MEKKTYQILSKVSLFFVIVGFCLPIVVGQNGFNIAKIISTIQELIGEKNISIQIQAVFLYIVFFAAILSLVSAFIRISVDKELYADNIFILDVILLLLSIICGIKSFSFIFIIFSEAKWLLEVFDETVSNNMFNCLGIGFYFIVFGWVLSFTFLLLGKEENFYKKAAKNAVLEATKNKPNYVIEKVKTTASIKEFFTGVSACCYYFFIVIFFVGGFFIYF